MIDARLSGWLVAATGVDQGKAFQLSGMAQIGRSEDNDIVLSDPRLSDQHAAITQQGSDYTLQDMNSTNGTFLNEEQLTEPRSLREGDRIRVGDTTLTFQWKPPADRPQPASTPSPPQALPIQPPASDMPAPLTPHLSPAPRVPAPVTLQRPPPPPRSVAPKSFPWLPFILGALGIGVLILTAVAFWLMVLRPGSETTSGPVLTVVVTNTPRVTTEPTITPAPTASPIPSATPILGPVTVRVAPDGSGDYPDLEAAVAAVGPGSTISLDPGTYRLARSLKIAKPLSLRGAGMDQTFVVGTEGDEIVLLTGPGTFAVEGITFRYEGTRWARVMTIDDAEIDITHCRFTGGIWSEAEGKGGDGILIRGNTTGRIRECRMEENEFHGIEIQDQSQLTLESNIATNNGLNGITYWDDTGGLAQGNECSGNGYFGISVSEQAQPTLEANTCSNNGQTGICYSGSAGGMARGNECFKNGVHGISVDNLAQPTLEENNCHHNLEGSGIAYSDDSGGAARLNKCLNNGAHGIAVQGRSQPTLEENTCRDNLESGIVFLEDAGGVAQRNVSNRNGLHGIGVLGQAQPLLEDNTCSNNAQVGIRFAGSSGGTARQNLCQENGVHGIEVSDQAQPSLEGNDSARNAEAGIIYLGGAGGIAQGNTSRGNKWGIYVKGPANPDLVNNETFRNSIANTVLFADDFGDPDSGWWIGSSEGGEVRYENGELYILDYTVPSFSYVSQPGRYFTDLIVEVESRWVGGTDDNWHGLYCRYMDSDNHYVAAYSADGYYTGIAKVAGESNEWAKERSDAIQQGTGIINRARLECVGSDIRFYINDTLLFEVTDTRLTEGDIALDAESEDGDYTEIVFDNLLVIAP